MPQTGWLQYSVNTVTQTETHVPFNKANMLPPLQVSYACSRSMPHKVILYSGEYTIGHW